MINFEISEIDSVIKFAKLMHPNVDFDTPYFFYYDETNNIKTFYVRENDFNYTFTANFVLGGLVHDSDEPNVDALIKSFNLQKTANEVKFKHIAFGEFLDCLKSSKLKLYLQFIKDSDLYIHYSSLNILYWSLVDIVDSAIMSSESAMALGLGFANRLKNDLYKLARLEIDAVIDLFYKFGYPNIKSEEIIEFVESLSDLFEPYLGEEEFHFGLESLRQILKEARKKGALPFVMDEKDYILLSDLSQFYLRPIYTFKSSTHVFDNEESIKGILGEYRILDNGIEINSYSFTDSQDSKLTQLSDIFVGLMGKFTQYRNTHKIEEIEADIKLLTPLQSDNLNLFIDVILKSEQKNPAFLHSIDSMDEIMKFDAICRITGKR